MPRFIWPLLFLVSWPLALVSSFLLLASGFPAPSYLSSSSPAQVLSATTSSLLSPVTTSDARPLILARYLRQHNSPLLEHATRLVEISDQYRLDYRLLVAIARQESNLCKRIPPRSYNCWGYGIYGDNVTTFADFPSGAERVAKLLKRYQQEGLDTPEKIMTKYTPPSATGDGAWARQVTNFLTELQ